LILPQTSKENFAALYNVLNGTTDAVAPMVINRPVYAATATYAETGKPERRMPTRHKVKKGETLAAIADRYGVEVHDLKIWNNLESNRAPVGQTIRVAAGGDISASVSGGSKSTL
jgi:membrane-bound lytic murein transglycosylase D